MVSDAGSDRALPLTVRFWEARVGAGSLDEAQRWVAEVLVPGAESAGCVDAEIFVAEADAEADQPARIVVLTRWSTAPSFVEPVADPTVIPRAHAWNFLAVEH